MNFHARLDKYAKLAVEVGANVQKDQVLILNTSVECMELNRLIVKYAYERGAKLVHINYNDQEITRLNYEHQSVETLSTVPEWLVESRMEYMRGGCAILHVVSNYPGNLKDISTEKLVGAAMATRTAFKESSALTSANKVQWSIVAAANKPWAQTVFPDDCAQVAEAKLWEAIFDACRVQDDNEPISLWNEHNKALADYEEIMNNHAFTSLVFTNSLGTNLEVQLVPNHIWAGGSEVCANGVTFNPNIPTEEVFTMPLKTGVNGVVVSSKPLDYQGKLIENFKIEFKDGKAVKCEAEKELEALESLINFDEGSCYLGEVALVGYNTPISASNLLFNNTLFDENASCHLALGNAYPMNVQGGTSMSEEELVAAGANISKTHVDFMFGTSDLEIVGKKANGDVVTIFSAGNFVL